MNDIFSTLIKVKADLIALLPQLLLSLVVILAGVIIAYTLKWLSSSLVRWVVKIIPRNIFHRFITKSDVDGLSRLCGRIIFFIVIFLTIATALKKLGLNIVSSWFQSIAVYVPNMIAGLIIVVFGWKLKKFIEEILSSSLSQVNLIQSRALSKMVSWAVFIILETTEDRFALPGSLFNKNILAIQKNKG